MAKKKMSKGMSLRPRQEIIKDSDYLSTGSTPLNLAISGKAACGFLKGKYYLLVGDSTSGKTFLSLTCFAEAILNKSFKDYRLIHDDVEDGALMDFAKFFGKELANRVEPPAVDSEGMPVYSETIEDFYYHVDDANKRGIPFIYVVDSMDSLSSADEEKKFAETKEANRKGTKTTGSFGDGKAKKNSSMLRQAVKELRKSGSILIIISQTRDNLGFGFDTKTRAGGRSLRFYACTELWTSVVGKIKKTVKGKPRVVGVKTKVQVKKNRITGKDRSIELPIYNDIGIDDIGGCVDYLIEQGRWKVTGKTVKCDDFDFSGSRDNLITKIEDEDLYADLQDITSEAWAEAEAAASINRTPRYVK